MPQVFFSPSSEVVERPHILKVDLTKYPVLTRLEEIEFGTAIQKANQFNKIKKLNSFTNLELAEYLSITPKEVEAVYRAEKEARKKLTLCNVRLVIFIAKSYIDQGVEFNDLIQEGLVGLMRAPDKFDPSLGHRFTTYCSYWIKQAITLHIAEKSRTIRMPPYITGILNKVKKTNRQLSQSLMRTPTLSELAEAMDMPLEKLEVYLQANKSTKSIDNFNLSENIGDSSAPDLSKSSCLDIIADPSNVDRLDLISDKDEVIYYLSCLTPIQRTVVTNYYGLTEDNTQYRFSEIAKMINLTPQRTRHIYKEAMGRMTRLMEAKAKINNQRNNRYLMRIKNKTVKEG